VENLWKYQTPTLPKIVEEIPDTHFSERLPGTHFADDHRKYQTPTLWNNQTPTPQKKYQEIPDTHFSRDLRNYQTPTFIPIPRGRFGEPALPL